MASDPCVVATIGGIRTSCLVDSGSDVSIVSLDFCRRHKMDYGEKPVTFNQVNNSSSAIGRLTTTFTFHN